MIEVQQSSLDMVQFYRENPIIALEELLGIELAIPQRVIFKDMWFNKFVIQTASRGTGKTYLCAAFACLYAMLYPGTRIGLLAPSFRQCVTGDAYIITDDGMKRVVDVDCTPNFMVSSRGLDKCSARFNNLPEKVVRIETTHGYNLSGAVDHRVLVPGVNSFFEYKSLDYLNPGDYVCIKAGTKHFGGRVDLSPYKVGFISRGNLKDCNLPNELDSNLSYFLGLVVGDGCLTQENVILFTNTDSSILEKYTTLCGEYFGSPHIYTNSFGVSQVFKGSKLGYTFLKNIGLAGHKAETKKVPDIVLSGGAKEQSAFIRGLFDSDGFVYFNKDVSHSYKVGFSSVSEELINQIQLMLLNFGIISLKCCNNSKRCRTLFTLEISNKKSILSFKEFIGFSCEYKSKKLVDVCTYILKTDVSGSNKDVIPGIGPNLENLVSTIRKSSGGSFEDLRLYKYFDSNSKYKGTETSITFQYLNRILNYCDDNGIIHQDLKELRYLLSSGVVFLKVKNKIYGFDYTYDFTVEGVHNYVSNGFVSHNSKLVFEEAKTIWNRSDILREATSGKPTMQSDRCILYFKSVGSSPHSLIESDPLGTGEKIRGLRMHVLLIDEFAQMPEEIFDAVIKPMTATVSSPMENVRRLEKIRKLKAAGIDTSDLEGGGANKIIMVSSAFYKFNHMYKRIENYQRLIESGQKGYVVRNTNYLDMPTGFMNDDTINEAKETMPAALFRMEYLSIWESDSDGVFKASLLESCRLPSTDDNTVKLFSEEGKQYVVGCDPARTTDAFSIVIIELGNKNKVVNAYKYVGMTFPKMADTLVAVCDRYNVVRVVMDSQGGGNAIKDLVSDSKYGNSAIIDIDDPDMVGINGKRILELVNPAPKFNADANYSTLSLLEHGKMFFPCRPLGGNQAEEEAYDNIDEMILQMRNIVVTETRSGVAHFDVPVGGGHGKQKKDLYSAMIYASNKIHEMENEKESMDGIIWGSGIVVPTSGEVKDKFVPFVVSPFATLTKK